MNFKLKTPLSLIVSGLVFSALSACNNSVTTHSAVQNTASQAVIDNTEFGPTNNMQGSQAAWLSNNNWLLTSKSKGLVIADSTTQQSNIIKKGNFEALSVSQLTASSFLVATIDNNQDNVIIFKLEQHKTSWKITEITRIAPPQARPDTVCLFANKETGAISAFVPDVRGLITETIIFNTINNKALNIDVREFSGVNEASGCTVSTATNTLFVSEGEIGIWAINANAESKANKKPIALVAPFGALNAELGALSTSPDGMIWFTSTENNQVYAYDPISKAFKNWTLSGGLSLESVAINYTSNSTAIAILYNDETGVYMQSSLPVTPINNSLKTNVQSITKIKASAQTTPVQAFGDAADDPAIWINPKNTANSLILGTDKRRGLMVYNLNGKLEQSLEVGRLNNVDLRQNNTIKNNTNTLITASNRSLNSISVFTVQASNNVKHITDIPTNLNEIYGLCMYSSGTGNYVFVNDKSGLYQQYKLNENGDNITGKLVREFNLPSQPEGCSADDKLGQLFVGEEDAGIWFIGAEPTAGITPTLLQTVNEQLIDDVEGMEIYHGDKARYLVVSSQGDDSYVLYKINGDDQGVTAPSLEFAGKFSVISDLSRGIDGVSETDGLTVTAKPLPGYPEGILVVQDGYNRLPQQPQNFKIVDWREVKKAIK
ncbi:phytase [Pseudoalteromonas aliena]|uniref:Phytase n=1 Tax=Pseudoalteromonas aliena TaxID=247523 RepID=A0A1Q2GVH9_9GAMM|nr:phytase [Pseudoalteromonas aliena]AQP99000.1 phytase [Pseudoalteromonas aliena]AQQ01947.1 phytase [Pseudoalteromonas aliena]